MLNAAGAGFDYGRLTWLCCVLPSPGWLQAEHVLSNLAAKPEVNAAVLCSGASVVASHAGADTVLLTHNLLATRPLGPGVSMRTMPVFCQVLSYCGCLCACR